MKASFVSTRGYRGEEDFLDVVRLGLAPDGGLFVPEEIGALTQEDIQNLAGKNHHDRARAVLRQFPLGRLTDDELTEIIAASYGENFADARIAPLVPLEKGQFLLELFHGPTAAFKDIALQCTPKLFARAVQDRRESYCILAATSGDTGVATIAGYAAEKNIRVVVLYPAHGVSPVQEAQMLARRSETVHVLPVDADFDFCQRTVKQIFSDEKVAASLGSVKLSSANSINWGRLLPQVVYWVSAYADLVKEKIIAVGDEIDVTVPTGNFGNILSAHYAMLLGLPIRRLVVASNENNVLTDFIETGAMDLRDRTLHLTSAPSIDILRSSNTERLLYLLANDDSTRVAALQAELEEKNYFSLNETEHAKLVKNYRAGWCSEEEVASVIKKTFEKTGYLLDTHTAVAKKVADDVHEDGVPMLIAATAHWAKFPEPVAAALGIETAGASVAAGYAAIAEKNPTPAMHRELGKLEISQTPPATLTADYDTIVRELNARLQHKINAAR